MLGDREVLPDKQKRRILINPAAWWGISEDTVTVLQCGFDSNHLDSGIRREVNFNF